MTQYNIENTKEEFSGIIDSIKVFFHRLETEQQFSFSEIHFDLNGKFHLSLYQNSPSKITLEYKDGELKIESIHIDIKEESEYNIYDYLLDAEKFIDFFNDEEMKL